MLDKDSRERPGLEALFETVEAAVDVALNGDLLASIPIVGIAFKIAKAADSIRDRALAEKLSRFALELASVPASDRAAFQQKLLEDPADARKVGETLFLVLEHVADLDKPALLAAVFVGYLGGIVSSSTMRRLAQAIDVAFFDDLRELVMAKRAPKESVEPWMQYLASSGLTRIAPRKDFYGETVLYELAPLGHTLRDTYYFHARAKRKSS